jgi:UDP-N-acetylmuramate--alanine ligase
VSDTLAGWSYWTPPAGSIPTRSIPSLDGIRALRLIGIGGAGMRNLARLFVARGFEVSGSDLKDSGSLAELRALGVRVDVGHDGSLIGQPDAIVVSSAIRDDNPEVLAAAAAGIPIWWRQQALAALASGRRVVSVSGAHGKTTTTSMIASILERAGLDPSYLIGGDLNESGSGARHGDGELFVFEADESDGSFLLVPPWTGVITNVDLDHVDFYPGGLEEIQRAFAEFAERSERVIACGDDPIVRAVLARTGAHAITYGRTAGCDLIVRVDALGPEGARGTVRIDDEEVRLELRIDGAHNLLNATAAIATTRLAGVSIDVAVEALATFEGVHRRFEHRGDANGAAFFDDYGQTPVEMEVTVASARRRRPDRLIALVQPHRYWRVRSLWRELGASVAGADLVVVTDVYGAAQDPIPGVTGKLVVDGVQLAAPGLRTVYLPHRTDVVSFLEREVRPGDLVVTMGCGDVWMLGDAVRERIEEREARAGGTP